MPSGWLAGSPTAEDWTFMNMVEVKSEKQVESRRVEYFDADGGHVS